MRGHREPLPAVSYRDLLVWISHYRFGSDPRTEELPFPAMPPRPQGANPPSPPANLPPPATHPAQLIAAMNWAIAENQRSGSKYYQRLDSTKVAVMGQSCGGVQAIEVAADPRITTAVIWNSGLFPKPTNMGGAGRP